MDVTLKTDNYEPKNNSYPFIACRGNSGNIFFAIYIPVI